MNAFDSHREDEEHEARLYAQEERTRRYAIQQLAKHPNDPDRDTGRDFECPGCEVVLSEAEIALLDDEQCPACGEFDFDDFEEC